MADESSAKTARVTIGEVAKAGGVSKATVSRVLNGLPGHASAETEVRVREVASKLGYVSDLQAAGLRRGKTKTVGLVIADITNPFFAALIVGLETELQSHGYSLVVANTGNRLDAEVRSTQLMSQNKVDGIVLAPSGSSSDHLVAARSRGAVVVLVDSVLDRFAAPAVVIDNHASSHSATQLLLQLGHRRIAYMSGPQLAASDIQRMAGYVDALRAAGATPTVHRGDFTEASGRACGEQVMAAGATAVLVANNLMTVGLLHYLHEVGVSVPEDISLIGFDDQDWYPLVVPALSAIEQPAGLMGREAGRLLLEQLSSKRPFGEVLTLSTHLRLRDSVAAPRPEGGVPSE